MTFVVASCSFDGIEDFSLTVKHYGSGAGVTIIYSIDNKGLQVNTNCDLANCKKLTVYKRTFSESEKDSIVDIFKSLRLDTLKRSYKHQGYYDDGFYAEISLKESLFSTHKSTFDNVSTPTVDSLIAFVDDLVTKPEFRLATWGQTQ
jgi:hypothetical protein